MRYGRLAGITVATAAALVLAACGESDDDGGGEDGGGAGPITFWTLHNTPQRMALQEATAERFTEETGIEVEVVGLAYNDMNQSMVSGAASGDVPDVVLHFQDQAVEWNSQGLLDVEAAGEVLDELNHDTFNQRALEVVTVDDEPVTVPSDAWGQMLFYRTDLFEQAGLEPPETLEDVATAAETLNSPDVAGIVLGTSPGESYTTQNLEWISLINGCQLTAEDDPAQTTLDSPECVEALGYYQRFAEASVAGAQTVDSARATYLAGQAAMISFSPHLLDEIAGLDSNFPPACAQCAENTAFLAENTGILPVLQGSGEYGGQFGQTVNLGIMRNADTDAAKQFVEFLLSDGYEESLAVGAEGRFPLRSGPEPGSEQYVEAWADIPIGPDPSNQLSITELYGEEFITAIQAGVEEFARWGFGRGAEELGSALATQGTLTRDLEPLFQGADPAEVAATMNETATGVAEDLGE